MASIRRRPAAAGNPQSVTIGREQRAALRARPHDAANGTSNTAANRTGGLLHLQRTAGNRAVAAMEQRSVASEAANKLSIDERPSNDAVQAVFEFKPNAKKTPMKKWEQILRTVKPIEAFWNRVRDHVMIGEASPTPKGLHSIVHLDQSPCELVGKRFPASGTARPYKQWQRKRGDRTYENLKISSFFPKAWSERKIKAAALLKDVGADHQVAQTFNLATNEASIYPDLRGPNPTKPTADE